MLRHDGRIGRFAPEGDHGFSLDRSDGLLALGVAMEPVGREVGAGCVGSFVLYPTEVAHVAGGAKLLEAPVHFETPLLAPPFARFVVVQREPPAEHADHEQTDALVPQNAGHAGLGCGEDLVWREVGVASNGPEGQVASDAKEACPRQPWGLPGPDPRA